jgi:uncharacterized protein (TIRG00374 family)
MAILLLIILVSQIRPLALTLLEFGEKLPIVRRFMGQLREFYEGSFALFRPKATAIAVGIGVVSWLWEGVGLYVILLGLGIDPSWQTLSIAVFVISFSTVIGAVSALPGGLGAAEVSIAGMLSFLLNMGADTATAATLLIRFATLWFGVGLGLIVWAKSRQLFLTNQQE